MNKILFISAGAIEYNSSSSIRAVNLINGLSISNKVDVIEPYEDYKSKFSQNGQINFNKNTSIHRYGLKKIKSENKTKKAKIYITFRRLLSIFSVFDSEIKNLRYISEIQNIISGIDYNIIISLSNPKASHLIANMIKKSHSYVRYIQYWGDPITTDVSTKDVIPKFLKRAIENRILMVADEIFYTSPFTLAEQKILFPNQEMKMRYIPSPAPIRIFAETSNRLVRIGYFGNYYSKVRNIIPLCNAIKSRDDIEFVLVGDTDISLEKAQNIKIMPRLSKNEIDKLQAQCDIIVNILNNKGNQIPGKVFQDACTNSEIILIVDGGDSDKMMQFFKEYQRYNICLNDENSIKKELEYLIKKGVGRVSPLYLFENEVVANQMIFINDLEKEND